MTEPKKLGTMWSPKLGERYQVRLVCKQCLDRVVRPNTGFCSDECQSAAEVRERLSHACVECGGMCRPGARYCGNKCLMRAVKKTRR